MLTKKQSELLLFIHERLAEGGVSPSFDEMKEALNLRSKSGIHRLITALEERGFLRRLPHRARALEVLRLPDRQMAAATADGTRNDRRGADEAVAETALPFRPPLMRADRSPAARAAGALSLPMVGRIAAGNPIEALSDTSQFAEVPGHMVGPGNHYVLEVTGDSMVDAGILDGDLAVIRQCDTAENGAIVVALVEEGEATLKRLRRRGASVALEAANPAYETRIFGPNQVKVQGRLVGLMRRYG